MPNKIQQLMAYQNMKFWVMLLLYFGHIRGHGAVGKVLIRKTTPLIYDYQKVKKKKIEGTNLQQKSLHAPRSKIKRGF